MIEQELDRLARALERRPPMPWLNWLGYCALHLALAPFLALNGIKRARRRGYGRGMMRRFAGGAAPPKVRPPVILHAGGLGEVRVAARIARIVREARGVECAILFRSDDAACADFGGAMRGRLPFNNPLASLAFLLRWRPRTIVTIEFHDNHHQKALARLLGVRQIVVNVPVTEEEAERVLGKGGDRWRWAPVDAYLATSEAVRSRLERIGVPPERVGVVPALGLVPNRGDGLSKAALGIENHAIVIVAGSTYPPEEALLREVLKGLRSHFAALILVLAPRHLRRAEELPQGGRRSRGEGPDEDGVLVLDTVGELRDAYAAADVAYVGGTYGVEIGGHTPMEAIGWGVPVLVGPQRRQHADTVAWLEAAGAARTFADPAELTRILAGWIGEPPTLAAAREAARRAGEERDDPTLLVFDRLIAPTLSPRHSRRQPSS